jgi:hypothetical protein
MFLPQKKALEEHRRQQRYNLSIAFWFVALDNGGLADVSVIDRLTLNHIMRSGYRGEPIRSYLGAIVRIAQALRAEITVKCINQFRSHREVTFVGCEPLDDQVFHLLPPERFSDPVRAGQILGDANLDLETLFDCAEIACYVPFIWIDYKNDRVPNEHFLRMHQKLIGTYRGAVHV